MVILHLLVMPRNMIIIHVCDPSFFFEKNWDRVFSFSIVSPNLKYCLNPPYVMKFELDFNIPYSAYFFFFFFFEML